ncbi:MAG: COX15/CtaA family protein [Acidimicrobiales bacterium]
MARTRSSTPRTVSPATFARITRAALAAQVLIVCSGVAVRLTGSGLGCSDWPRCESDRFVAPLEFHPMIEFVNRMVSFVVAATVILAVWGALRRIPYRRHLLDWTLGIAAISVVQVVIGAITVRTHLSPPVVMTHFLLSMLLIWMAVRLHHAATVGDGEVARTRPPAAAVDPTMARLTTALLAAGWAVLVTGTVVTGSGPHGGDENVERLGFYVPTVTRYHTGAVALFLTLLVVILLLVRARPAPASVIRTGTTVLTVTVAQGAIGYYQYFNGVPELVVFLHILGSMAVWGTATWFVAEQRHRAGESVPDPRGIPTPVGGAGS